MVAMTSDTAHAPMLRAAGRAINADIDNDEHHVDRAGRSEWSLLVDVWRQPFTVEQLAESRGAGVLVEDLGGGLLAELKDQKVDIAH